MKKPDFEKYAQEANEMQGLPPASVEVSRLGVVAIITLIQAAVQQQPDIADDEWAKIGIAAARQLQKDLFNQDSATYKVLEFGWNPESYIVTPSVVAAIIQNIESRRFEKNSIIDFDGGRDETVSQKVSRKILESQGYQFE
jgi:hypothetical protein